MRQAQELDESRSWKGVDYAAIIGALQNFERGDLESVVHDLKIIKSGRRWDSRELGSVLSSLPKERYYLMSLIKSLEKDQQWESYYYSQFMNGFRSIPLEHQEKMKEIFAREKIEQKWIGCDYSGFIKIFQTLTLEDYERMTNILMYLKLQEPDIPWEKRDLERFMQVFQDIPLEQNEKMGNIFLSLRKEKKWREYDATSILTIFKALISDPQEILSNLLLDLSRNQIGVLRITNQL
jgi:hypothetical protein